MDLIAVNDLYKGGEKPPQIQQYLQEYEALQKEINSKRLPPQTDGMRELTATRNALTSDTLADIQQEIEGLESRKQEIYLAIRRYSLELAAQLQVDPLSIEEMQQLIENPKTAVLSFFSTNEDTHIFILRQDQAPQLCTCTGQGINALQNWIFENWLRPYLEANHQWHNNMEAFLSELSERLQLKELIEQYLTTIEELIIVPHLSLHQIPFAALPIEPYSLSPVDATEKEKDDRILAEVGREKEKIFAPFKRSIDWTRKAAGKERKPTQTAPLIKGGRGGFDSTRIAGGMKRTDTQTTKLHQTTYLGERFRLRIVPSCQILNFCYQRQQLQGQLKMGIVEDANENLPFNRYECQIIAQSFQVPRHQRLQGKQATLDNFKQLLKQINRLHTSHHAGTNWNNPLDSCLQLADNNLTLRQLLTWEIPTLADIFMSCCETNLTLAQITDEPLTLATGFLTAGARSVVSTLWSVSDLASALLATIYYDYCQEGLSRSLALQKAQFQLRTLSGKEFADKYKTALEDYLATLNPDINLEKYYQDIENYCQQDYPFAHPYYWAGFISQGLA